MLSGENTGGAMVFLENGILKMLECYFWEENNFFENMVNEQWQIKDLSDFKLNDILPVIDENEFGNYKKMKFTRRLSFFALALLTAALISQKAPHPTVSDNYKQFITE